MRHHGAVALDVHVDVAVEVGDVEQALEVVGGDVALPLEQRGAVRLRPRAARRRRVGLDRLGARLGVGRLGLGGLSVLSVTGRATSR